MQIIIDTALGTDNVTTLTADSEDASFPVENLQNDFTTDLWKAASGTTATLTLEVSKGSAVELLNTNATQAVVTAGSGESFVNESGYANESGYVYPDDAVYVEATYDLPGAAGRLWADYAPFTGPHIVTIALTAAGVVQAGIVRAGNVEVFRDPAYNNEESSNDYSIEREMNNGADYFRKRNVVRTFSGLQMYETRENAWKFKHDIFDAVGPKPLAIRLIEGMDDDEFVLFAKRVSPPRLGLFSSTHSLIQFDLKEVI